MRGRLAKLAGSAPVQLSLLSHSLPNPWSWSLDTLCEVDAQGAHTALTGLLQTCSDAAYQVSEEVSATYFTHSIGTGQSLGA